MTYLGTSTHGAMHDIAGELLLRGKRVSASVTCVKINFNVGGNAAVLPRGAEIMASLYASLSREAIRYIDEVRGKDDLAFQLGLRMRWQEAEEVPPPSGGSWKSYGLGAFYWSEHAPNWEPLASSTWKRCLEQMEYDYREVIEIPKLWIGADAALAEALVALKSAEGHARDGDWWDVISNCRTVFECLSRHEAPGRQNTRRGFDLLLERAYPGDLEAEHRERINALILELRKFFNFFVHVDKPRVHATRSEALLALNATASLVATIGSALDDAEHTRRPPGASGPPA